MQTSLWVVTQKLEKNLLQVALSEQFQKTETEPKVKIRFQWGECKFDAPYLWIPSVLTQMSCIRIEDCWIKNKLYWGILPGYSQELWELVDGRRSVQVTDEDVPWYSVPMDQNASSDARRRR